MGTIPWKLEMRSTSNTPKFKTELDKNNRVITLSEINDHQENFQMMENKM